MIKNRLSVLLAEKGLKITRVAKDTGISRNTITATAQNDTEMIRLGTINTLCKYLNIAPHEFFEYEPLDIDFKLDMMPLPFELEIEEDRRILRFSSIDADLFIDIVWGHSKESMDLSCELVSDFILKESKTMLEKQTKVEVGLKIEFDNDEERDYFVKEIYNNIDGSFYKDIYNSLYEVVKKEVTRNVSSTIDSFIDGQLNLEQNPTYVDPFRDSFFAKDLENLKDNIDIRIISDVFLPF